MDGTFCNGYGEVLNGGNSEVGMERTVADEKGAGAIFLWISNRRVKSHWVFDVLMVRSNLPYVDRFVI